MQNVRIDFCFQGWVRGADIESVIDSETDSALDVSWILSANPERRGKIYELDSDVVVEENVTPEMLIERLESGRWLASLSELLRADYCTDNREIHDFALYEG